MKEEELIKKLEDEDIKVTLLIGRKAEAPYTAGLTDGYRYFPFIDKRTLSSLGPETKQYIKKMVLEKIQESKNRELDRIKTQLQEIEKMEERIKNI